MKLSIKTVVLQEMVNRAIKGASQNKLLPLTSLMAIQLKDYSLRLITTDASNTLYIMREAEGDDFYAVVYADQFCKLVSKMTSENITLELNGEILTVKGNGSYKIELPLDENGKQITFPDPVGENTGFIGEAKEINLETIKTILAVNKAALATTLEEPAYTGYYIGDKVISTDTYKICGYDAKLFDEPILISPETMNLLDVVTDEKVDAYISDDVIEFISAGCIIHSHKMEGIERYAINAINNLLDEQFESSCEINKNDFLALLDRISLFVGVYDNKAITLTFTDKGIDVSSKQSNGVETIEYLRSHNPVAYTCQVNVAELILQIKAHEVDTIEIQYGNEKSIKIIDGKVVQVIALIEDKQEK